MIDCHWKYLATQFCNIIAGVPSMPKDFSVLSFWSIFWICLTLIYFQHAYKKGAIHNRGKFAVGFSVEFVTKTSIFRWSRNCTMVIYKGKFENLNEVLKYFYRKRLENFAVIDTRDNFSLRLLKLFFDWYGMWI